MLFIPCCSFTDLCCCLSALALFAAGFIVYFVVQLVAGLCLAETHTCAAACVFKSFVFARFWASSVLASQLVRFDRVSIMLCLPGFQPVIQYVCSRRVYRLPCLAALFFACVLLAACSVMHCLLCA